jgi:hypothetical protein
MKIRIAEVGHYHPSNANWSYGIWLVSNEKRAVLCKETFGGQHRMIESCKRMGHEVENQYISYSGVFKGREVEKMLDIENYHETIAKE